MRSWTALIAAVSLLMFSLSAGAVKAAAGTEAGPALILPETVYDFSGAYEGQNVRHDFVIQNRGDAAIDIVGVKTD
jgi:hypothetical protein